MELVQTIIRSHPLIQEMEPEALHTKLEILLDNCRDIECSNFQEICQTVLKLENDTLIAYQIIVIISTFLIASASGERSFSLLKLTYSAVRTNTRDQRLDNLMLLSTEKDIGDNIDLDYIVNKLSSLKQRPIDAIKTT